MIARLLAALVCLGSLNAGAFAAQCGGDFNTFLSAMGREAAAAGISRGVIDHCVRRHHLRSRGALVRPPPARHVHQGLRGLCGDPRHGGARQARQELMQRHAALLSRIERQFGVPQTLLMAIWTMETDNGGGDMGKLPVVRTIATLAHDCRRTALFQGELLAALKIVQRGDLPLSELVGAFAGEIGQTQFLPSSYIKYGVDYDGNGHVDLREQRAGRARLDRQSPQDQRLAGRRAVRRRHAEFRSHARVEPRRWSIARRWSCSPSAWRRGRRAHPSASRSADSEQAWPREFAARGHNRYQCLRSAMNRIATEQTMRRRARPRRRSGLITLCSRAISSREHHHAAQVPARVEIGVALVDLVERVGAGDQFAQLQVARR